MQASSSASVESSVETPMENALPDHLQGVLSRLTSESHQLVGESEQAKSVQSANTQAKSPSPKIPANSSEKSIPRCKNDGKIEKKLLPPEASCLKQCFHEAGLHRSLNATLVLCYS